jgi:hypothetical protein
MLQSRLLFCPFDLRETRRRILPQQTPYSSRAAWRKHVKSGCSWRGTTQLKTKWGASFSQNSARIHPPRACCQRQSCRSAEDKLWINQGVTAKGPRIAPQLQHSYTRAYTDCHGFWLMSFAIHALRMRKMTTGLQERDREEGSIHDENLVFFDIEKQDKTTWGDGIWYKSDFCLFPSQHK